MFQKLINKYLKLSKNERYFALTFFLFVFGVLTFTFYGPNYNGTNKEIQLDVPKGASFNSVADSLYEKNVIPSKFRLKTVAYLLGVDKNIKAGRYEIPDGISYVRLIKLLIDGVPKDQKLVTIQEGIWQTDLADLLKEKLGIDKKNFLKLSSDKKFIKILNLNVNSLEGYLLPETYYFYEGTTAEEVIKKLYNSMDKFLNTPENIRQMKLLKMNEKQILTMASIIDGESNKVSEFSRISGVYYNRLKKGWRLQADPTVQYVVRHRRRKVNKIYYKDLEIDSKFNTYIYRGLPPAPINNPGKAAIMAALYPEQNDYFYFVADGKGGHVFSKSGREHEVQVMRYRNWRENNR